MKKLRILDLVEFNRKSDRSKLTHVTNFQKKKNDSEKEKNERGGDYWVSCNSAIVKYFKSEDEKILRTKIDQLLKMIENSPRKQTKDRFQANIEIIQNFNSFNIKEIKPYQEISILKKEEKYPKIKIENLTIEVKPDVIFSFNENKIGSVWFLTKKGGFNSNELAMFSDILFRYINKTYSNKYEIIFDNLIVVDVFNSSYLTYNQVNEGEIKSPLIDVIKDFKNLM